MVCERSLVPRGGHECGEGRWGPSKPVAVGNVGYSVLECRGEDGCCLPQVACREERLDIVRALTKATCLLYPEPGGSILQVASAELAGSRAPCVPRLMKTAVFLSVWHANEYVMLQDAWWRMGGRNDPFRATLLVSFKRRREFHFGPESTPGGSPHPWGTVC